LTVVADFRGIWYSKETREMLIVDQIGVEVDLSKYTQKEPCEFCTWSEEEQDWVFSLDLYKEYAIQQVLNAYYKYLFSREPLLHQVAITGIMVRTLTILSTNKTLTDEQINLLSQIIQDCDSAFNWIAQVTKYELELENKVKSAISKEEIDVILSSINFSQFDSTYKYVTLCDKVEAISEITLVGEGENV